MDSAPAKWTHFTDGGSEKQASKRKENSQRNSKALHFSEIDIRRVQYWYRSVSDMPFGIWQIMKSTPCAIGKRTRTRSSSVSSASTVCLSVCLSVTVWLFPIHLRDVQRNINSSKHRREGWRGWAPPQNAPSSNFSPSALIVPQLSLFSSAVHLTANIITGLDRTSLNSFLCSV